MSLYKNKFNPLSGSFNLVPTGTIITFKDGVATPAALPVSGNVLNDARITADTGHLYVWDGTSWVDSGDIIDLKWSAIDGKPTSPVADIDNAVSLRHAPHSDDQVIPTALSAFTDDSTHRLVTDTEKGTWNGKQNALGFTPENVSNKRTTFQVTPDDTHYPSEKLTKDSLDGKAPISHTHEQSNVVDLVTDLKDLTLNIMLNAFRIAQIGSLTIFNMVKGFMDEYEDESGIDLINSINQVYNSSDDYYQPYGTEPYYGPTSFIGGTASASSESSGFETNKAFDYATLQTFWMTSNNACPAWLKYDLGSGITKIIQKISITARGGNSPGAFTFQGSNDNSNWSTLLTVTGVIPSDYSAVPEEGDYAGVLSWEFSNSSAYRYYKLNVTAIANGLPQGPQIFRLDGMELIPAVISNMTLKSKAQVSPLVPTSARIILFEEDVDSVTINTDLKAYVSRNNGTTYSQVTLEDEGNYITGARILSGVIDISGQPSDRNIKYKIETLNSKNLKLHGTAISWK